MKILVFLGGTTLIDRNLVAPTREEMVLRSKERDRFGGLSGTIVPIGNSVAKLKQWVAHGAEVSYFSSTRKPELLEVSRKALRTFEFPEGELYYRGPTKSYAEVAEEINPDVIVEDDCESIGREREMIYPNMKSEFRNRIASVVLKEFEGLDRLPDDPRLLLGWMRRDRYL